MTLLEEFTEYVLQGKTIKELQEIYGWSRTKVTDFKRINGLVGLSPNSKKLNREQGIKTCNSCKKELSLTEFYSNGKTTAGYIKYKPNCRLCENKAKRNKYELRIYAYLNEIGMPYACSTCGYTGIFGSLDFHHKDPNTKQFNIGDSNAASYSVEEFNRLVVPELKKCVLLCPNCHRQEHLLAGLKGFDRVGTKEMDNSPE